MADYFTAAIPSVPGFVFYNTWYPSYFCRNIFVKISKTVVSPRIVLAILILLLLFEAFKFVRQKTVALMITITYFHYWLYEKLYQNSVIFIQGYILLANKSSYYWHVSLWVRKTKTVAFMIKVIGISHFSIIGWIQNISFENTSRTRIQT